MPDQTDTAEIGSLVQIDHNLRLEHVVGQEEAISQLRDLVNRIKYSAHYESWGVDKPKALALTGPPGVGKTFSLRALANEAGCPLVQLCYEDLASHFYDEAIRRLGVFKAEVEKLAEEHGHVLVLIDEADSFFQSRFDSNTHASDKKKTNFFLRWIDGDLEGSSNFTIVATSNAWDTIDPAFRRAGRFKEIKYNMLKPGDLQKALLVHMELAEASAGRKLFLPFGEEFLLPIDVTGSDIKDLISEILLIKANETLASFLEEGELEGNAHLVTPEDILNVLKKRAEDIRPKRMVGFGRD